MELCDTYLYEATRLRKAASLRGDEATKPGGFEVDWVHDVPGAFPPVKMMMGFPFHPGLCLWRASKVEKLYALTERG